MPKCKKCGREIDHLNLTVRNYEYHRVEINEESRKLKRASTFDHWQGTTYRCPACYRWLFRSERQAEKFLKKGMKFDVKSKW